MSDRSDRWTQLLRRESVDSLGTKAVMSVAMEVRQAVGDPKLYPKTIMKVVRAAYEGHISVVRIAEICDYIVGMKMAKVEFHKGPGELLRRLGGICSQGVDWQTGRKRESLQ